VYKKFLILIAIIFTLLLNGCQQRKCLDKDAFNGIYNALTCDYAGRIEELEDNLTQYQSNDNENEKAYRKLLSEVEQKEKKIKNDTANMEELNLLIHEIDHKIDEVTTNKSIEPLLYEIRNRVLYMKRKLKK
jgi:peptidoglycan hydrolase CwlO-like protein